MVAFEGFHFFLTELAVFFLDDLEVLLTGGLIVIELTFQWIDGFAVGVGLSLIGILEFGIGFDESLEFFVFGENCLRESLVFWVEWVVLDGEFFDGWFESSDRTASWWHLLLKIYYYPIAMIIKHLTTTLTTTFRSSPLIARGVAWMSEAGSVTELH